MTDNKTKNSQNILTPRLAAELCEMYFEESRPSTCDDIQNICYAAEKCMYCGYEIMPHECKAQVLAPGDIIHEKCWQDYADENFYELCCVLNHTDGAETEEEYL